MAAILQELGRFFNSNSDNTIEYWKCLSHSNWILHKVIDRETKKFCPFLTLSWKLSWDFSKKMKCNNLINYWKMTFQALDDKEYNFLKLLDDEDKLPELTYSKGGT